MTDDLLRNLTYLRAENDALRAENKALRAAATVLLDAAAGSWPNRPCVVQMRAVLDEYPQREDDDK